MREPGDDTAGKRDRRRRIAALGSGLVIVAAVAAVAAVLSASRPGHARAARRPAAAPVRPAPDRTRPRGPAPSAVAQRNLRGLIALGRPIYCGGRRGNAVAFTFDDGPGVYTHYALRQLERAHERATFFLVGRSIRAWPRWLRRETRVAVLGDHTLTHPDLVTLSRRQAYQQIAGDQRLIERDSGRRVQFFRPPYGAHDRMIDGMVRRLGMLEVMWSVDSADSLGAGYAAIIRNVARGLRPGAIIELHENRGQTIRALRTLFPLLRRRHLRSVSLLQLLAADPPSAAQVRRGEPGCGEPPAVAGHE